MAKSALENMVPAWTNLVSVVVTLIVTAAGVYYSMNSSSASSEISAGSIASVILTYIPHIMLLFGVLADMFTYEGVYSIPSLVGLLSIPLNYVFRYFWTGIDQIFEWGKNFDRKYKTSSSNTTPAADTKPAAEPPKAPRKIKTPASNTSTSNTSGTTQVTTHPNIFGSLKGGAMINYDGCTVQGFESLTSIYAPQTLVVTATVFFYYIFDLLNNRGLINSLASILIGSMLYIGETIIISKECMSNVSVVGSSLRALVEGAFFGGTAYSIVQAYYPARLPSAAISPFPRRNPSDLKPGEDGRMYDSEGNAYIILPNGQTVPDLSKNEDRKKMADFVGETLGTGKPATTSGCSA